MSTPNPADFYSCIIEKVADYLVARAKAEVLLEQVATIGREILAGAEYLDEDGERITDPRAAWTVCDEQADGYYGELDRVTRERIPHDLPEGHCPALHADMERIDAERALLIAMGPMLGFDGTKVHNLDLRQKLIDNACRFVVAYEREIAA